MLLQMCCIDWTRTLNIYLHFTVPQMRRQCHPLCSLIFQCYLQVVLNKKITNTIIGVWMAAEKLYLAYNYYFTSQRSQSWRSVILYIPCTPIIMAEALCIVTSLLGDHAVLFHKCISHTYLAFIWRKGRLKITWIWTISVLLNPDWA